MALVVKASGTQTAVVGTEHTLGAAITDAGIYLLQVDTRNMVNGDTVELRCFVKTLTGDAQGYLAAFASYANDQGDGAAPGAGAGGVLVKLSEPLPSPFSFTATLKQTAGAAGRDFPWSIFAV